MDWSPAQMNPGYPRVLNKKMHNVTFPNDVYVGRPSKWGNPFMIGQHGTREEVIARYKAMMESTPALKAMARAELKGKNLVCWCAPKACHADVLLEVANG